MNGAGPSSRVALFKGDVGAVRAALLFGIAVVVVSEGLGAVRAFARGPIAAAWLLGGLGSGAALWRGVRSRRALWTAFRARFPRDPVSGLAVGCVLLVLAGCLVTLLLSPPNNWDVLTYHLPRVRHWIQNRSFAHYPSNIIRQISYPPGAGYLVAHFQLLIGGDRLASLPQWLALVGCILVTAALARRLAGPRAVIPTALACATAPMAVLQATNPQTDLLAAFWLACFAFLVFARSRYRPTDVVWLGCALGLGLATKPTVILFAPAFLAILAMRAGRRGWRSALLIPTIVVLLSLLPTLPNTIRNLRTFGAPLGPAMGVTLARRDVRAVASNILRHAALNYPIAPLWNGIIWLHQHVLHMDVNDPRTTFPHLAMFDPRYIDPFLTPDEDVVASPVHVTIALVAAAAVLRARGRRRGRAALRLHLVAALAAGFLLFCCALPWQLWDNRLLLPLLVLASPLIGWALAALSVPLRAATACLLGVIGILLSVTSVRHPLLVVRQGWTDANPSPAILSRSRTDLYFAQLDPAVERSYESLLRQVAHDRCTRIGLIATEYAPEYLLWVTLDRAGSPAQLRHVEVSNQSRGVALEIPGAELCGLVSMSLNARPRYEALRSTPPTAPQAPLP